MTHDQPPSSEFDLAAIGPLGRALEAQEEKWKQLFADFEFSQPSLPPELIKAGVQAWMEWEDSDDPSPENLVSLIFLAMQKALQNK